MDGNGGQHFQAHPLSISQMILPSLFLPSNRMLMSKITLKDTCQRWWIFCHPGPLNDCVEQSLWIKWTFSEWEINSTWLIHKDLGVYLLQQSVLKLQYLVPRTGSQRLNLQGWWNLYKQVLFLPGEWSDLFRSCSQQVVETGLSVSKAYAPNPYLILNLRNHWQLMSQQ